VVSLSQNYVRDFYAQARASKCNHDAIKREQLRHQLPSPGNKDCCFNRFADER
jgi:hypothetical protein